MAEIMEVIKNRSSIRGYAETALTDEEIAKVVEAGLMAPTATNRQEIHFTVVKKGNPILDEMENIKNEQRNIVNPPCNFYYDAPVVIFVSAETAFGWSQLDAGIAVENMALAAEGMGLGGLIIGCVKDAIESKKDYFAKALDFPEGYEYAIAFAVGHKATTKEPHTYDATKQVSYI